MHIIFFILIGLCNQKRLEMTGLYYHSLPPLPGGFCLEGFISMLPVQGAHRTSNFKCTLNLDVNRKSTETGGPHMNKDMTRERPLMVWFLHICKLGAIIWPADKQNSRGWYEFAKHLLFSVLKGVPMMSSTQRLADGALSYSECVFRTAFQYKNKHFSAI